MARLLSRAWLLAIALVAGGCGSPGPASKATRNVLRVPIDVPLTSLDPALVSDSFSIDVVQNTFQGLVAMGEDNEVHPCLAESWAVSRDGKTYTFHLRHDVKFQGGRTLTASDVKASMERACSSALAAPLASDYLNDIDGMAAFHLGKADSIRGIAVLDASTVRITLDAPHPYFLDKLTCPAASVVDCRAIKDGIHIRSIGEMAGTGPFRIERYDEGQLLVQSAFDGYWGGRPRIDGIERPVMRDEAERVNAYRRGEIDMIPRLSRANYAAFAADPKYRDQVKLVDRATLVYIALNARKWPDRRVRAAIAKAIDRDMIARDTMLGTVAPAKGIVPPGIPGHQENPLWQATDPDRARAMLSEAGYASGKGLPALQVTFAMENPDMERIADAIGAQLHETLGLEVRLDRVESASLLARQGRGDFDCIVSGWFADYMDPQDFLSMLLSTDSPENHWGFSDPEFDRRCAEADVCQDPVLRKALYGEAENIALSGAVLIPICYWKQPVATSPRVHGVRSYAGQFLPYDSVTLR